MLLAIEELEQRRNLSSVTIIGAGADDVQIYIDGVDNIDIQDLGDNAVVQITSDEDGDETDSIKLSAGDALLANIEFDNEGEILLGGGDNSLFIVNNEIVEMPVPTVPTNNALDTIFQHYGSYNAGRTIELGTVEDDYIIDDFGSQTIFAGDGDDVIVLGADDGEPEPAQEGDKQGNSYAEPEDFPVETDESTDLAYGGKGADTFIVSPMIDAKIEIIEQHRDDTTGEVDWTMNGVAGENDNVHDHWVDGVGLTVIADYDASEGDKIVLAGHTVSIGNIEVVDGDTVIDLVSDQGGNGGAHDGDSLGRVVVLDAEVSEDDIEVNAGVFYATVDFMGQTLRRKLLLP